MRKQALIPMVIGLLVGLGALKLGYDYLAKAKGGRPATGPVTKIVVASRPIPVGTKLTETDLVLVDMPDGLVPDQAVKDVKELVGQTIRVSLAAKLPVLQPMVGPGSGIRGVIPEGYRAVTVKVDEFTGVAGLINPGDRVDVVGTFSIRTSTGNETISKTVLQNVEVWSVGQNITTDNMDDASKMKLDRSVTLLVKPDQVEKLQLAASNGKIRLALRAPLDDQSNETKGITLARLLSGSPDTAGQTLQPNLLNSFLSAMNKRTGSAVDQEQTLAQAGARIEPYQVELIVGSKVDQIFFASRSSDQRVNPSAIEDEPVRTGKAAPSAAPVGNGFAPAAAVGAPETEEMVIDTE